VNVEIWSDIACPWCYVGKRRFESALASFEHSDQVQVTWRSFELDPDAPDERAGDRTERLAAKYGISVEKARSMEDNLTQVAAGEGLDFRFDRARSGRTFDAHRLTHLAAAHGKQAEMKERLMRGYLTEGELMSDHDTLERLATDVGLPVDEVRDVLTSGRYTEDVRNDEHSAAALGINGVPFFVVDRKIGASGAQPSEVLADLLRQGWEAAHPEISVVTGGDSCGVDGC
jgi:predicted DsbA family dithiol-disulfide isomerase